MSFKLSKRSLNKLEGVHPDLEKVVKRAIELTTIDFGVTQGTRTLAEQKQNVATGRSQTMKSKHLPQSDGYSHAVDVVAYVGKNISWEMPLYCAIAEAFRAAADELNVQLRWGAAWHVDDIREFDGSMEDAMLDYIDLRRSQGRKPFMDGPHFELQGY